MTLHARQGARLAVAPVRALAEGLVVTTLDATAPPERRPHVRATRSHVAIPAGRIAARRIRQPRGTAPRPDRTQRPRQTRGERWRRAAPTYRRQEGERRERRSQPRWPPRQPAVRPRSRPPSCRQGHVERLRRRDVRRHHVMPRRKRKAAKPSDAFIGRRLRGISSPRPVRGDSQCRDDTEHSRGCGGVKRSTGLSLRFELQQRVGDLFDPNQSRGRRVDVVPAIAAASIRTTPSREERRARRRGQVRRSRSQCARGAG